MSTKKLMLVQIPKMKADLGHPNLKSNSNLRVRTKINTNTQITQTQLPIDLKAELKWAGDAFWEILQLNYVHCVARNFDLKVFMSFPNAVSSKNTIKSAFGLCAGNTGC